MKKALLILLITTSPALADDQNIYDFERQIQNNSDNVVVEERTTADIKRHMANLLYPVDMTSFARPEKDAKFREQIIALQKQMGVAATGTLTVEQAVRLADAARDIDDRAIRTLEGKTVQRSQDGQSVSAVGIGDTDEAASPLGQHINISRIFCQQASGICELSTAAFSPKGAQLYFYIPSDYSVTTWEPTRVTATSEEPCATSSLSIDIPAGSVTISSAPHSDLSFCPKVGPTTWRLLDHGFPVAWKLHQDRVNKARALVYEPERKLVPPVADASTK